MTLGLKNRFKSSQDEIEGRLMNVIYAFVKQQLRSERDEFIDLLFDTFDLGSRRCSARLLHSVSVSVDAYLAACTGTRTRKPHRQ